MINGEFLEAYSIASNFTATEEDLINNKHYRIISYVKITDKEIMACNGFKAIIIKCDCIPEELKNTLLYPHLKKNFPEEAIVNIENKYPPLEKFFPQPKDYQHSFFSFNAETFYKRFTVTRNTVTFNGVNADCLEIGTRTIFFDSKLLREAIEAIEAFNDEEFAVHVANWKVLPLFLDNSKRKICVMPLRIVTDEEAFYSE